MFNKTNKTAPRAEKPQATAPVAPPLEVPTVNFSKNATAVATGGTKPFSSLGSGLVIDGNISVTMLGSHGRYRIETMEQGDVGYIPQGYGHSIENTGSKSCRILIGFNTGVYETIDLSQWIAGNPADVLATNFGQCGDTAPLPFPPTPTPAPILPVPAALARAGDGGIEWGQPLR